MKTKTVVRLLVGAIGVGVLAVLVIPTMIGFRNYDGDLPSCPTAQPAFFQQAVRDYYVRNNKGTPDEIEFIPGSHYDAKLSTIAFRKGDKEYYAIVDCRGGLELSEKPS